ncbi:hypothetical protein LA080_016300 [Diaporthe eres]|nr:hypothetical protein LA080_016300 [Diaporthe eres]
MASLPADTIAPSRDSTDKGSNFAKQDDNVVWPTVVASRPTKPTTVNKSNDLSIPILTSMTLQCLPLGDQRIAQAATGLRHGEGLLPVTGGSRTGMRASLSGLYNSVHCTMYSNVQHGTSLQSSKSDQRAALRSGGPGMSLFDAATPLQKLEAPKNGKPFTPVQAFSRSTRHFNSWRCRPPQPTLLLPHTTRFFAVPPPTVTEVVVTAFQAHHALDRLRSSAQLVHSHAGAMGINQMQGYPTAVPGACSPRQSVGSPIHCDKWIHDGTCAFTQQGCKYQHEIFHDRETRERLGLFHGYPAWWKK